MGLQRAPLGGEQVNKLCFSNRTGGEINSAWNLAEQLAVIIRSVDCDDDGIGFDSEFLWKRRSGITSHGEMLYRRLDAFATGGVAGWVAENYRLPRKLNILN